MRSIHPLLNRFVEFNASLRRCQNAESIHSLLTQHLLRAASYTWEQSVTLFKGEVHTLMSSKGLIAALITFMPLVRLLYLVWGNKGFYRFDWNNNAITDILNQPFKQQQQNNWKKKTDKDKKFPFIVYMYPNQNVIQFIYVWIMCNVLASGSFWHGRTGQAPRALFFMTCGRVHLVG